MKYFITAVAFLLSTPLWAVSNDLGRSTGEDFRPLTAAELQERLEVVGEIFTLDATGTKLLGQTREVRRWRPRKSQNRIESNWGAESDRHKPIAIHHVWTVEPDGTLRVLIEQFERTSGERGDQVKFSGLLKKEEITVKDFSPITWVSVAEGGPSQRVVLRFTPVLRPQQEELSFTAFPLSGREVVVSDNEGSLWTEHVSFKGTYTGIVTHRGAVLFSLYPFPGAKELGRASGKEITLEIAPKRTVTLRSESDFLPDGLSAKVYGAFRPGWKTARFGSTQVKCSDQQPEFLKSIE